MQKLAEIQIDRSFFSVLLLQEGIVHVRITGVDEITVEQTKEIIECIGEVCQDQKRPSLVSSDNFAAPTAEAREYIAKKDSNPYVTATAYIARSLAEKIMTNAFIHFNKPVRPTKMFTNEKKAIEWLKTFL
jgi:hypothetical protein